MTSYYYNLYAQPQEDEWDRSTVLNPLWEYQQKKTFISWCNSHLRKAGTKIENLEEDFQNGLKLMLLLEVISGEPMPRPDRGCTRFHRIANVNKALDFIRRRGVKLVSLGAEAIVDGNQKMILGLIWTLILRFAIQNISFGDLSARDGLLLWCQRKTEPYKNVDVQNFSNSWRDGLAFCALIHRHRPELIDYNTLSPSNPTYNLNLVFNVAEKHLDIPPMLDANDVQYPNWPDEISTITYLSSFYHAFEGPTRSLFYWQQPKYRISSVRSTRSMTPSYNNGLVLEPIIRYQTPKRQMTPIHLPSPQPPGKPIVLFASDPLALEKAAKKIADELSANAENKECAEKYCTLATDLLDFANKWIPWLQKRADDESADDIQQKLNCFRHYQTQEKPARVEQKDDFENLYTKLQTRLKLGNRSLFQPKDGQLIKDINKAWHELEVSEKGCEEWLLSEMARLERLKNLMQKFNQKYLYYQEWSNGKYLSLSSTDYRFVDLYDLKCLRKKHDFFNTEMANNQEKVEQIIAIANELARLRYHDMVVINRQCDKVCENWQVLTELVKKRWQVLVEREEILKKLDNLHLKFASSAHLFNNWASSTQQDLVDMVIVSTMNEIEQLLADHNSFKETLADADASLKDLLDMDNQVQALVQQYELNVHNPYTDLTVTYLQNLWNKVQTLIPSRDLELEQEYTRQKNNARLMELFVEKSNQIGEGLEKHLQSVLSINLHSDNDESKKLIVKADAAIAYVHDKRPQFNELEQINQQLQNNFVFTIPDSKYTMKSLRVGMETLMTVAKKTINDLENQRLIMSAKQVNSCQLNEYRKSFNHFDKDQKGLNEEQLRSFLISIGHNKLAQNDKQIFEQMGIKNTDRIQFDALLSHLHLGENNTSTQLYNAFRMLANNKSQITAKDLRRELPEAEANRCLQAMDKFFDHSAGHYDYDMFCKSLYS